MSAITFACIAVLAIVGVAVYAIHRKASLKVSAKAPGEICRILTIPGQIACPSVPAGQVQCACSRHHTSRGEPATPSRPGQTRRDGRVARSGMAS